MKFKFLTVIAAALLLIPFCADAQSLVITLEQALEIAMSENVSVKVADLEIKRTEYAKKGAYAALYPQIDLTGSYQRTIKKQVMYMTMNGQSMGIEVGKSNTINAGASAAMPVVNAQLWGSLKLSALYTLGTALATDVLALTSSNSDVF